MGDIFGHDVRTLNEEPFAIDKPKHPSISDQRGS